MHARALLSLALAVAVGTSCAPAAETAPPRDVALRSIVVASAESLAAVGQTAGARSVDELVPLMPEALRARYLLVFESRSLQGATFRDPRVLLYSEDLRFIVSFNGDPATRGHGILETMEFDDARRAFRLHEISFPEGATGPVVSEANPPRCVRCHGSDPRPLWDTYPTWPGVYGERDHVTSEDERAGLTSFLEHRPANPRYRALLGAEALARRSSADEDAYHGRDSGSRNAVFGLKLQRLRYRTIARKVIAAPRFGAFGYALLATLDGQCLDVEAFLPPKLRSTFARSFGRFADDTERANAEQEAAKVARIHGAAGPAPEVVESLTPFRYVVEEGLGLSTDDWTTALERGTFDFHAPQPLSPVLERELREAMVRTDPDLRRLKGDGEHRDAYCAALRRRSLAALSRLP